MRILVARFKSGEQFLEHYLSDFDHGGLFYPSRTPLPEGESVIVDVRMPALRDYVLLRGSISWHRRGKRADKVRAGLGIAFAEADRSKRDYLRSVAGGRSDTSAQRRHRRLPTEFEVNWRIPNDTESRPSVADDISPGGMFIRTRELPPMGASILLQLVHPGATTAQTIEGRVAWQNASPGAEGVGVEFRCRDIGGMRRLRELVKRLERAEA